MSHYRRRYLSGRLGQNLRQDKSDRSGEVAELGTRGTLDAYLR